MIRFLLRIFFFLLLLCRQVSLPSPSRLYSRLNFWRVFCNGVFRVSHHKTIFTLETLDSTLTLIIYFRQCLKHIRTKLWSCFVFSRVFSFPRLSKTPLLQFYALGLGLGCRPARSPTLNPNYYFVGISP